MSDLGDEQGSSLRLWLFAGLGALVLHVGGVALALAHLENADLDDTSGAPAIEIGLEMMSPHLEPTDLPPGPEQDAAVASAATMEQKAEVKESELPREVPTKSDDPDRIVTPNSALKPTEEDAKVAEVSASASVESVATEARAMPSVEAVPEGPRSVAPAQGVGESVRRQRATWQKELNAHLHRHLRYPAERSQQAAESVVNFVLDRKGHVLSARIVKGSGDAAFDEAALAMVRRSDPMPLPPPAVADEGLDFTLPVSFTVKGKS
jgi:protein TonB